MSDDWVKGVAAAAVKLHQALTSRAKRGEWRSISQDPPTPTDMGPAELQLLGREVRGTIHFNQNGKAVLWVDKSRALAVVEDYEFWRSV